MRIILSKRSQLTIDVDACKPNLEWPNSWLANLPVSQVDKETLTTRGAWLSDAIMNAAQTVLKKAGLSKVLYNGFKK